MLSHFIVATKDLQYLFAAGRLSLESAPHRASAPSTLFQGDSICFLFLFSIIVAVFTCGHPLPSFLLLRIAHIWHLAPGRSVRWWLGREARDCLSELNHYPLHFKVRPWEDPRSEQMVTCLPSKLFINVKATFTLKSADFALYYYPPGAHVGQRQKLQSDDIVLLARISRQLSTLYLHTASADGTPQAQRTSPPMDALPRGARDSPGAGVRSPSPLMVTPYTELVPMPESAKHARSVPERMKKQVAYDQAYHCAYCQGSLPAGYQVDHVLSLDAGGTNEFSNLAALCVACHDAKTGQEFHQITSTAAQGGGKAKGKSKGKKPAKGKAAGVCSM